MQLEGKKALVIGGTRGIGRGIVEAYLRESSAVVAIGRDGASGHQLAAELEPRGSVTFVQGDATDRVGIERAIDQAHRHLGGLDILVNNVGGCRAFVPLDELTDDQWDENFALNLRSVFFAMRHVIPVMKTQRQGRIINISSMRSKKASKLQAHYSAAKAGVNALTRGAAHEVGPYGITVNAICVGIVATDRMRRSSETYAAQSGTTFQERLDRYRAQLPTGDIQSVEVMADLAVFFASDSASCITAACYSADGGMADY